MEVLCHPDRDRIDALGEVRPDWRSDHEVLDLARGTHPEEGLGGIHERTQVQARLVARRYPRKICSHERLDGPEEVLGGELWQGQATSRGGEPRGVRLGAEGPHRAVCVAVGLEPFEDLLPVVQDGGRGVELQRTVLLHAAVGPASLGRPPDACHVVREHGAELGRRKTRLALLSRRGSVREPDVESCRGVGQRCGSGAGVAHLDGLSPGGHARRAARHNGRYPVKTAEGTGPEGQSATRCARSVPISAVDRTRPARSARSAATAASTFADSAS